MALNPVAMGQTTQSTYTTDSDATIYYQYETRNDLNVAYIQNFGLDNYTHVNVTMIEASNNIAWDGLKKDFKVDTLTSIQKRSIHLGYDVLQLITRDKKDPQMPLDMNHNTWEGCCYCIVSNKNHTLWIFHTNNRKQMELINRRFLEHTKVACSLK